MPPAKFNKPKERQRSAIIAEHGAERYSTYDRGVFPRSELKIRKKPGISAVRAKVKALGGKLGRAAGAQLNRAATANSGKRTDNVNAMEGRNPGLKRPNVSPEKPEAHKRAAGVRAKVSSSNIGKKPSGNSVDYNKPREMDYSPTAELARRVGRRVFDVSAHATRKKSLHADQARAESFVKRLAKK
jgi:hypothetical protein